MSVLLQYGANVNQKDASGKKAIDLAEKNRSEESLAILKSEIGKSVVQNTCMYVSLTMLDVAVFTSVYM